MRYDSPVFVGFSVSASWGEDDNWAVSGRYVGEWHDFKVAAAVAYNASTDENGPGGLLINHQRIRIPGQLAAQAVQAGAYIEHIPTGLWVYGAYSKEFIDTLIDSNGFVFGLRLVKSLEMLPISRKAISGTSRLVSASAGSRSATRSSTASTARTTTG